MGKTSSESKNKYRNKVYDQINIIVPKGQKETLQTIAQTQGESLNGFIKIAIDERVARLNEMRRTADEE